MKKIKRIVMGLCFSPLLYAQPSACVVPSSIKPLVTQTTLKKLKGVKDIRRNWSILNELCVNEIAFDEGKYHWKMLLVTHPHHPKGAFWFLPHDDEATAFDSALYATQKYGGGFLMVMANDNRYFKGQDPNRNFGTTRETAKTCPQQKAPAPQFTHNIFKIIDAYRGSGLPYLALHNNKNGWYKNGGEGGVSILATSSSTRSYLASKETNKKSRGLKDEDSLVYIAGTSLTPPSSKLNALLGYGMNTKYEIVSSQKNDCSLSNYVVLNKKSGYYNLETQHGDLTTQKKMIDHLMKIIK